MRTVAAVGLLCLGLAFAGCGGDDDAPSDGSDASDSTVAETTPSKAAKDLDSCLRKAGYKPTLIPPPPEGAPGSEFGSTGSVRVDVGQKNAVVAVFLKDPERAERLSESPVAPRGAVEVIGSAFLSATLGKPKELDAFRTCLER